jgi:hypothetical protein
MILKLPTPASYIPAVDDLGFDKIPPPDDVGVVRIEEPAGIPSMSVPGYFDVIPYIPPIPQCMQIYNLTITLKNFGSNSQTNIPVSYILFNGGPVYTTTWTGTLLPDDTILHTVPNSFAVKTGTQTVSAYTQLPGDIIHTNDTSVKKYYGDITYCQLSIDETGSRNFIQIGQNSPNPASQLSIIPCYFPADGRARFGITDPMGRELFSEEVEVHPGDMEYLLDVSPFPPGIYIYFSEYENSKVCRKMMVMRF